MSRCFLIGMYAPILGLAICRATINMPVVAWVHPSNPQKAHKCRRPASARVRHPRIRHGAISIVGEANNMGALPVAVRDCVYSKTLQEQPN